MAIYFAARDVRGHKRRVFWPRLDYITGENVHFPYDDSKVVEKYRLTRGMLTQLANGYANSEWGRQSDRSQAITENVQIQAAIRFMAEGATLGTVGQLHGVSTASMSRILEKVSLYLCSLAPQHIRMPQSQEEKARAARGFHALGGMPLTVGAVDGTHIEIVAPSEHEHAYVNRHAKHSINVQVCCGPDMLISDIVARFPGSCHDGYILRMSDLHDDCEAGELAEYVLLGDSAYPLKKWLVTPVLYPRTEAETRFNVAHKTCRAVVERTIGLWKSRFRFLHVTGGAIQVNLGTTCKLIVASAVLHNMCVRARLPQPAAYVNAPAPAGLDGNADDDVIRVYRDGLRKRENIIRTNFT